VHQQRHYVLVLKPKYKTAAVHAGQTGSFFVLTTIQNKICGIVGTVLQAACCIISLLCCDKDATS